MVIRHMSRRIPLLAKRFLNMLWVQLHSEWELKQIYKKADQKIFVTIFLDPKDRSQKIRRSYSMEDIRVRDKEHDLWGLAQDCSYEIKMHANENNQT